MTREYEDDDIRVEYEITDETFDHAFGREKRSGFEITSIHAYIPALNDWMDVSHMGEFIPVAFNIVNKEMEKAA